MPPQAPDTYARVSSTTIAMRSSIAVFVVAGMVSGCGGAGRRADRLAPAVAGVSRCLRSAGFGVTGGASGETLIGRLGPSPPRVLLDVTMPNDFPASVAFYGTTSAARHAAAALGRGPPFPVITAGDVDVVYLAPPSEPSARHRQTTERCGLGTARRTAYNQARPRSGEKLSPPRVAAPPAPNPPTPAAARGRALVGQSGCLACHQIGSAGNDGPGANLSDIGHRLSRRALGRALVNPRAPMPSFQSLTGRQIRDIVSYLAGLTGHPGEHR